MNHFYLKLTLPLISLFGPSLGFKERVLRIFGSQAQQEIKEVFADQTVDIWVWSWRGVHQQ